MAEENRPENRPDDVDPEIPPSEDDAAPEAAEPAAQADTPADEPAAEAAVPAEEGSPAVEEDEAPREKPAIPGMDLEVDIVREGEAPLRGEGSEYDEDMEDEAAGEGGLDRKSVV